MGHGMADRLDLAVTGIIFGCILLIAPSLASAGNECRIQYGWNTGNSLNGTFKNHSAKAYLDKGETKTFNKNRLNYVKNLKTRKAKFYLGSASDVTLGKNQRNPAAGTYVGTVKLKKAKCLGDSSSSSSGSMGSSSGGIKPKCPVGVSKIPAGPAGKVPVPYPSFNCK